jgi:SAM-dependent methyltransferase
VSWTKQAFDRWYLLVYPHRDDAEANRVAVLLGRIVPLANTKLLDLGCGPGRHLRAFACAGAAPVGLDRSAELLARAAREPKGNGARARLVRGDMRSLPFTRGAFDGATSLFTTLGYSTEDDDRRVLDEAGRVVRDGGFFLLDFLNRERVLADVRPETERVNEGYRVFERRRVQNGRRVIKRITIEREGSGAPVADYEEQVTLYAGEELSALLEGAGFRVAHEWGDYEGSPWDSRSSPRHLFLAFKDRR